MTNPILIVGSGLAGYTVARELRKLDKETPLTIVTTDDGCFYSKPMLSNALAGGKTPQALVVQPVEQMRAQLNASILTGVRLEQIDATAQRVQVNGEWLPYAKLVLALGAEPVRPQLGGDAAAEVLSINDLSDYARFRAAIEGKRRIVILGGGLIGCEFANDLRPAGFDVAIVHPANAPLERMLPQEASAALHNALTDIGVAWHFNAKAEAVSRVGEAYAVTLSDGTSLQADVVLSAVGLRPRTALAQAAGIQVKRGIVANRHLETSVSNVYALGDCAEVEGLSLLYVLPLMSAARALAKTLAGEKTALAYPAMPVVIKTPVCPLVVSPPPAEVVGSWRVSRDDGGITALYYDQSDKLRGFALVGKATAQKNQLAQLLPPLL